VITKYTSPCEIIRGSFLEHDFTRISHKRHHGWSRVCARVLSGGIVRLGDEVHLIQPPAHEQPASISR
jgi:MOSC domain-containing protein YiiM